MAQASTPLVVQCSEYKAKRTLLQNRYYQAILRQVSQCAWVGGRRYSPEVWAHHFKGLFIGAEDGISGPVPISTTTLSVAEFSDYVSQVEAYCASELGLDVSGLRSD